MCPSLAEPDSGGFPKSSISYKPLPSQNIPPFSESTLQSDRFCGIMKQLYRNDCTENRKGGNPLENFNQRSLCTADDAGSCHPSKRGICFAERYCRPAGHFQEISGTDCPAFKPYGHAANKSRLSGRLSACKIAGCLYGRGDFTPDRR